MKEGIYLRDGGGIVTGPFAREMLLARREMLSGCCCSLDRCHWVPAEQFFPSAEPIPAVPDALPAEAAVEEPLENDLFPGGYGEEKADGGRPDGRRWFAFQMMQFYHPAAAARGLTVYRAEDNFLCTWILTVLLGIGLLTEVRFFAPLLHWPQPGLLYFAAAAVCGLFLLLGFALGALFWWRKLLPAALAALRLFLLTGWSAALSIALLPGVVNGVEAVRLLWGLPLLAVWGWYSYAVFQFCRRA